MVFLKDALELRYVQFNKAGEQLTGLRVKRSWERTISTSSLGNRRFFTARDREALTGGAMLDIPAEPVQTKDHGLRWLHTRNSLCTTTPACHGTFWASRKTSRTRSSDRKSNSSAWGQLATQQTVLHKLAEDPAIHSGHPQQAFPDD